MIEDNFPERPRKKFGDLKRFQAFRLPTQRQWYIKVYDGRSVKCHANGDEIEPDEGVKILDSTHLFSEYVTPLGLPDDDFEYYLEGLKKAGK